MILFFSLLILSFWYRGSDVSIGGLKLIIFKLCSQCFVSYWLFYCGSDPKFDMHISYVSQRVHSKLFWECQFICSIISFCLSVFIYSSNDMTMFIDNEWCFGSISCPLSWKFIFLQICFFGDLKIISSVLFTFKDILFALSHWTRLERSQLIVLFNFFREWLAYKSKMMYLGV